MQFRTRQLHFDQMWVNMCFHDMHCSMLHVHSNNFLCLFEFACSFRNLCALNPISNPLWSSHYVFSNRRNHLLPNCSAHMNDMVFTTLHNITKQFIGTGTDCSSSFFLTKHFTHKQPINQAINLRTLGWRTYDVILHFLMLLCVIRFAAHHCVRNIALRVAVVRGVRHS